MLSKEADPCFLSLQPGYPAERTSGARVCISKATRAMSRKLEAQPLATFSLSLEGRREASKGFPRSAINESDTVDRVVRGSIRYICRNVDLVRSAETLC